jgi:glycosyltransferase involved in cell wall biosynthesis
MEAYGGAERITAEMAVAFPEAPVWALLGRHSIAERMQVADRFRAFLPPRRRLFEHYRLAAPLFPAVVDRLRLPECDVVLSSSYAYAHRLRSRSPQARHVCFSYGPPRFYWSLMEHYRDEWAKGSLSRRAFEAFASAMRRGDRRAAAGVDLWITQSPFTAGLIEEAYGAPSTIIGAPVSTDVFVPGDGEPEDYYLFCGRIVEPYKRVRETVEAFRGLPGERLLVAGDGPVLPELRASAPANVEFLGELQDDALVEAMQGCRALVFPSRDDFGLMPVEAMSCGRPVLADGDGGALYTVKPGVTGEYIRAQTPEAIREAVAAFDPARYEPGAIREHALQWDRARWRERLVAEVERVAAGAD